MEKRLDEALSQVVKMPKLIAQNEIEHHQLRREAADLKSLIDRYPQELANDKAGLYWSTFFRDQPGGTCLGEIVKLLQAYVGEEGEGVAAVRQIRVCEHEKDLCDFVCHGSFGPYHAYFFVHDGGLYALLHLQSSLEELQDDNQPWEKSEQEIKGALRKITPDICMGTVARLYNDVHGVEPPEGAVFDSRQGILLPLIGYTSWLMNNIPKAEFIETLSREALSLESDEDMQPILKHFQRILGNESGSKRRKLAKEPKVNDQRQAKAAPRAEIVKEGDIVKHKLPRCESQFSGREGCEGDEYILLSLSFMECTVMWADFPFRRRCAEIVKEGDPYSRRWVPLSELTLVRNAPHDAH